MLNLKKMLTEKVIINFSEEVLVVIEDLTEIEFLDILWIENFDDLLYRVDLGFVGSVADCLSDGLFLNLKAEPFSRKTILYQFRVIHGW